MKTIKIEILTSSLSPVFREELLRIIKENPGDCSLSIFLKDGETDHGIEFNSKKYKVSYSEEMKDSLSKIGAKVYY